MYSLTWFVGLAIVAWLVRRFSLRETPEPPRLEKTEETEKTWLPSPDLPDADPPPYRPFKPIYHITMALQSTAPEDLIVLDRNYKDRVDLRRRLIADHPETVLGVVSTDGRGAPSTMGKDAVDELYAFLMDYLPQRHPSVFTHEAATASIRNHVTGAVFPCAPAADPAEALRILGETVEDDLLLLQEEADEPSDASAAGPYPPTYHRLVAFLTCFPAGFDPAEKLGQRLRDIHVPVPAYDKIGPSMERFFSRLAVGKSAKRLNWSVQTHGELFLPKGRQVLSGDRPTEDTDPDISQTHMRVECQTINRLPRTRAILFSFKTYLFPLAALKAEGHGPALADAIDGLQQGNAPGMWTYKGAVRWGPRVTAYLRAES